MNFKFSLSKRLAVLRAALCPPASFCRWRARAISPIPTAPQRSETTRHLRDLFTRSSRGGRWWRSANDGNLPQNTPRQQASPPAGRRKATASGSATTSGARGHRSPGHRLVPGDTSAARPSTSKCRRTGSTWHQVFSGGAGAEPCSSRAMLPPRRRPLRPHALAMATAPAPDKHRGSRDPGHDDPARPSRAPRGVVVAARMIGKRSRRTRSKQPLPPAGRRKATASGSRYDLGALAAPYDHLDIAWFLGDSPQLVLRQSKVRRTPYLDQVFSGRAAGMTVQLESYASPRRRPLRPPSLAMATAPAPGTSIAEVRDPGHDDPHRPQLLTSAGVAVVNGCMAIKMPLCMTECGRVL